MPSQPASQPQSTPADSTPVRSAPSPGASAANLGGVRGTSEGRAGGAWDSEPRAAVERKQERSNSAPREVPSAHGGLRAGERAAAGKRDGGGQGAGVAGEVKEARREERREEERADAATRWDLGLGYFRLRVL